MPHSSERQQGCRVSDEWTYRGLRAAILENELIRVVVLLDKGAEVAEFTYKPLDFDPLLRLPGGFRNPAYQPPSVGSANGNFLDYYGGGWQEILPNGGPALTHKGAEYGQHGEVCLVPWQAEVVEDRPERVSLSCTVRLLRTPLVLKRTMTLTSNSPVLTLDEELTCEAGEPVDLMWGHHLAFGLPFLQEGAVVTTSARRLMVEGPMKGVEPRRLQPGQVTNWPFAASATDNLPIDLSLVPPHEEISGKGREMMYLSDFGEGGVGWYALTNPARGVGVAMRWDSRLFRYLWFWQEFATGQGYPWWGRAYTVALEPWTSYPTLGLSEAVARGTQLTLQPGQTVQTRLTASLYQTSKRVAGVAEDGTIIEE